MTTKLTRLLLVQTCILALVGGCAGGPGTASQAQTNQSGDGNYEYDGWLFKSLTGRKKESASAEKPAADAQTAQSQPTAAQGVVQATANVPSAVGPLVPGPSSRSSAAGPPPTIPAELPPPPEGAISIASVKSIEEQKKKGFELADIAPDVVLNNIKKAAGYGPDEKIAKAAKKEGDTLFKEKKYKEASEKYATAAARWPDSPLEEDALFLQAESEFFADLYPKAHDTYGGLLKKYSNTRYLDTVMIRQFALGRYWEQLYTKSPTWPVTPNLTQKDKPMFDTFGFAVQAYERIRAYDPKGPMADDSLMALGNAYFLRGRWGDAAEQYDLLCKEYPNSEFQLKAHQFGLQANMRKYQGSAYDETPLKDADKMAKTALTQYHGKLGDEEKRVANAAALIREEQANRDFVRAEYYAKHRYYGSARIYFQGVVKDYPGTTKAKEAQQRLEEIKNEPDEPPKRLGWLMGMFGNEKK